MFISVTCDETNWLVTIFNCCFPIVVLKKTHSKVPFFPWHCHILTSEQYGFRTNSSTEKASNNLIYEILLAINNKSAVGWIFCDLQKAFDCVNHSILLEKLKFYGIMGKFHSIMKSYLEGRYQKVNIYNCTSNHNTSSDWMEIKHGVHQGSVLGPLFFLIYINDLTKFIK